MIDNKTKQKARRKKDLERKKYLLGNAFLALSRTKKTFSSENLLTCLNSKAHTLGDKKLTAELHTDIASKFAWAKESCEPELIEMIIALKSKVEKLESSSLMNRNSLKCLSDENITANSRISGIETAWSEIPNLTLKFKKSKDYFVWFFIWLSIDFIVTLYMFFMFKIIPAQ
ncbi:hypothetical protein [Maridesulfovibrio ferrireducens]|uniref:hypothetical protein n=1 Tax=Maridesulfovibrio ferrireducens TaxID=246191 RepID=UPI001A307958|nr:hypothetical protein [Maridesulfovibrio ferrireducens]MBI9112348.1 hypothetical protein [Maridesulfovibrio ferrireducens]